jgi:hypothetical protein
MAVTEKQREAARRRLGETLARIHEKMAGVTEEEVLEALRDDDDEPPKNGRGARRRASAPTRTPSPRA